MRQLAPVIADPAAKVIGLHVYTFNNVAATEAWRKEAMREASPRRHRSGSCAPELVARSLAAYWQPEIGQRGIDDACLDDAA